MKTVPKAFQSLLWSSDTTRLDLQRNAPEIIHKVLAYGDMEAIGWLRTAYAPEELRHVFLTTPLPVYTPSAFYFASHILLHLAEASLNSANYVKSVY